MLVVWRAGTMQYARNSHHRSLHLHCDGLGYRHTALVPSWQQQTHLKVLPLPGLHLQERSANVFRQYRQELTQTWCIAVQILATSTRRGPDS